MNRGLVYLSGLALRSSREDPLTDAERGALSALLFLKLSGELEFTTQKIVELIGASRRTVWAEKAAMRIQMAPPVADGDGSDADADRAGNDGVPVRAGRPRKLDSGSIAHLLFAIERDRELDPGALARLLRDERQVHVAAVTVSRCLDPYVDRVVGIQRTVLTPEQRHARLLFATRYLMQPDRSRVLYTDECYIKQKHGVRWRWVHKNQKDAGRFAPVRCGKESLCIWAGLRLDTGATELCIIASDPEGNHIIDARKYISILRQFLIPFLDNHPDTIFQQDNARPHMAEHLRPEHGVSQFLYDYNSRRAAQQLPPVQLLINWPPYSPDLSPIEYAWATLKQLVRHHVPSDMTVHQLRSLLPALWSVATSAACRRAYADKQQKNLEHTVLANGANDY